jgi:DNA-binding transcriptional regulator YdaS (Cro superfamily)
MDLRSYAAKHGRGALLRLARRMEVHPSRLYEIARGHVPKPPLAKQIEAATKGEVTAAEVLGLIAPRVRRRRTRSVTTTAPSGEHGPNEGGVHPSEAPDAAAE